MQNGVRKSSPNEFTTDSVLPKRSLSLQSVAINERGRLEIVILDKTCQTLEYPVEWLRHNCQCDECYNQDCLSYKFVMREMIKKEMKLKSVAKTENGMRCVFTDDHAVEFCTEWLYNRRMTSDGSKERSKHIFVHKAVPWNNFTTESVQKRTFQEITETVDGLEAFTSAMISDGIFIITNTPDRKVFAEFGEKTGIYPVPTHYGLNFDVVSEPTPTNVAYTTATLDFHVDLAMLNYYPSIQLLHCIEQANVGGENIMVDGVKGALLLRERHPECYHTLTTLNAVHSDLIAHRNESQYYMAGINPTIILGSDGEPKCIRANGITHNGYFPGTPDQFVEYAEALKQFYMILEEIHIKLKTSAGEILVFDNQRVMHGRLEFPNTEKRRLEGWYIGWDAVYSANRIAKIKQSKSTIKC